MTTYLLYREYEDEIDKKYVEEIVYSYDSASLNRRLYKNIEKNVESLTIENQKVNLFLNTERQKYGLGYIQGGGIATLFPEKYYKKGDAKKFFNIIKEYNMELLAKSKN